MSCNNNRKFDRGYICTPNTHKNMIARDVTFVSTDVDGKHDSDAIVIDIGL